MNDLREWKAFLHEAGIPEQRCEYIANEFFGSEKTVKGLKQRYKANPEKAKEYLKETFDELVFDRENQKKNDNLKSDFWLRIILLLEEERNDGKLSLDELFSQTTFTRLVYVRPNIETLARTAFSYTTATNAMMPTALEPWTEFPASRFQSLKPGRYSPISNISNWIEVHEKINVQDFFMEINWATRSIYHAEISTDLLIKSTAIQADILIDVDEDIRALCMIKCEWKLLAGYDRMGPINLIEIFESQKQTAMMLINAGQAVPESNDFGVYWAISQIFGYMITRRTKYGLLSTFNQTWFLYHEGDGRLYVSQTIYCDKRDQPGSPGLLNSLFQFLRLLIEPEARLSETILWNTIDLTINEYVISYLNSSKPIINAVQSSQPTSQATERQRSYQFNFDQLGPCIGEGATGFVRTYKDYFDGQVLHPTIAIKFIDISDRDHPESDKLYEYALNEVKIYKRLDSLQDVCIPRLLFHCPMHPFYLIAMTCIDGKHLKLKTSDVGVLGKLDSSLKAIHRLGVIHNDFRPGNILVDKSNKPWIMDFAYSYIDDKISVKKANEIESVSWMLRSYS